MTADASITAAALVAEPTAIDPAAVAALGAEPLDWRHKGLPAPVSLADLGRQGWNALRDLPMPVMLVLRDPLQENVRAMAAWCADQGVLLAPHGKTTMAPQLFALQAAAGAWAITCATPAHLGIYRRFGVARVLYANELVEAAPLRFVSDELRRDSAFELYCLVDSVAGVERMAAGLVGAPRPVRVLVEIGHPDGRGGCRSAVDARRVAEAVAETPLLRLAGVEAFEGLRRGDDIDAALAGVDDFLGVVVEAFDRVHDLIDGEPILTAGGSAYFDHVVTAFRGRARIVIRSGCYITQDGGFYQRVSPLADRGNGVLHNALEVWGAVLSRPEPTLAIVSFGRRDVPYDMGLPVPVKRARDGALAPFQGTVLALSDQHAHVAISADADLAVGDLLGATVSHPCGAFDRWRLLYVVDPSYAVVDGVLTFF